MNRKNKITIPERVRILSTSEALKAMVDHCIGPQYAINLQGEVCHVLDHCFDSRTGLVVRVEAKSGSWWIPPKAYAPVVKRKAAHAKTT